MDKVSIKIKNYACFGEEPQGFNSIKSINILIGKNNSGKSRLIDLIEFLEMKKTLQNGAEIIIGYPLTAFLSDPNLKKSITSSEIKIMEQFGFHTQDSELFINKVLKNRKISISYTKNGLVFKNFEPSLDLNKYKLGSKPIEGIFNEFVRGKNIRSFSPLNDTHFRILRAERDVKSEPRTDSTIIDDSGKGATSILRRYLQDKDFDKSVVTEILLAKLNEIVTPDMDFNSVDVRVDFSNDAGEIYLQRDNKMHPIPLSVSGSGLKTVLLVLIYTLILPSVVSCVKYRIMHSSFS